jgi:multidrug efflux system outer membrane protein
MFRALAIAIACTLAQGCMAALTKDNPPRAANREVPAQYRTDSEPSSQPSDAAASQPADNLAQKHWKEIFSSPALQELIELALRNNQELNLLLQEIIIAQNEVSARRGEYLPKVGLGLGAGVEKVGGQTSQGVSDQAHGLPENLGNFGFGLKASWEIDAFGKLWNAAKAANFRYFAAGEAKNFLVTQLIAEIANSYYELIALDNELDVLHRNIKIQSEALEVVKLEKQSARVTQLAVQRFEAEVLKNRSRLFDVEQARVQVENRINFLAGRYPSPVERNPEELLTPLPEVIAHGIPSQLLKNRPDVRQAENELSAADMDVRSAWARFFPSLSIDASLGFNSFSLSHLVAPPESLVYNLAGNLLAPLLNLTGIRANYRTANARQLQAVFNFERTLLQAFIDVTNQLVKYDNLQKSYELQSQQVDTLTQSVEISNVLFRSARADYMEVLLTRRDSLDAQLELIETKKRLLRTTVNIYQALGGGWRPPS